MSPVDWVYIVIAFGSVAAALAIIVIMGSERKRRMGESVLEPKVSEVKPVGRLPFKVRRSVMHSEVEEARDKLRMFGLEREILSYAIRRLYEAQAEGKITEEERDGLAGKYKEDMRRINEEVSRGESIVALNELEGMQEDLLKLFNERFDELNRRIGEMRSRSGIEEITPLEVIEEQIPTTPEALEVPAATEQVTRRRKAARKKPAAPAKSEAEKKVEQIMAEVEKVLARLEQMEVSE